MTNAKLSLYSHRFRSSARHAVHICNNRVRIRHGVDSLYKVVLQNATAAETRRLSATLFSNIQFASFRIDCCTQHLLNNQKTKISESHTNYISLSITFVIDLSFGLFDFVLFNILCYYISV